MTLSGNPRGCQHALTTVTSAVPAPPAWTRNHRIHEVHATVKNPAARPPFTVARFSWPPPRRHDPSTRIGTDWAKLRGGEPARSVAGGEARRCHGLALSWSEGVAWLPVQRYAEGQRLTSPVLPALAYSGSLTPRSVCHELSATSTRSSTSAGCGWLHVHAPHGTNGGPSPALAQSTPSGSTYYAARAWRDGRRRRRGDPALDNLPMLVYFTLPPIVSYF